MRIGFGGFIGSTFPGLPRPDVTDYPVLAMFWLPAGRRFRTFDQYELEPGVTTLTYPVFRRHRGLLQAALLERAIPASRTWIEDCHSAREPSSF